LHEGRTQLKVSLAAEAELCGRLRGTAIAALALDQHGEFA
jgi:hypothetical protein